LYDLKRLVAGDQIKVERGDDKVLIYKVVKSVTYAADKVDMAAVLTPITKGRACLSLITCGGEIDTSGNHYKDRLVVFAEQVH
jgi:sortase (surface protein transpeptidase)